MVLVRSHQRSKGNVFGGLHLEILALPLNSDLENQFSIFFLKMSATADFNNPLRKFKLVFLGEQSGEF